MVLTGVHGGTLERYLCGLPADFDMLKTPGVEQMPAARGSRSNAYVPVHCTDLFVSATVEAYLLANT